MAGQVGRGCTATTIGCGVAALLGALILWALVVTGVSAAMMGDQ